MHLKTMKVIEFPKNKVVKDKMKIVKLERRVGYETLGDIKRRKFTKICSHDK
ncbi:uncharacterized protein CBO05P2_164 [Clostridium botulinum B str. Osaka05]|uniref:Uncharacterized protein n=1 Tax=Clostridium botulinum B str. Osaka05 TaxID=1407017 RepID=A0A060NA05_CLOBO|nr:uncharacterized protein CBO05P2_164 [Clostridium botulinum B str. Osaka05]